MEINTNLEFITLDQETCIMEREIEILKDFMITSLVIDTFTKKLSRRAKKTCNEKNIRCTVHELVMSIISGDYWMEIPSFLVNFKKLKAFLDHHETCRRCLGLRKNGVKKIAKKLETCLIVQAIESTGDELASNGINPFNRFVLKHHSPRKPEAIQTATRETQVEKYPLDDAGLLECAILEREGMLEKRYRVHVNIPFSRGYLDTLLDAIKDELVQDAGFLNASTFNDALHHVMRIAWARLDVLGKTLAPAAKKAILHLASFAVLGLGKLYPLLVDDQIEEIFIDSMGGRAYLDHVTHDRCITGIILDEREENALITMARRETNKQLNEIQPTLKCTIQNEFFHVRINIDVAPFNHDGFSLAMRRLDKRVLDIIDLIANHTMSFPVAAFLTFCVQARLNVTITGTTTSGKTTLLNALDMLYPAHFRKIYVEDAIETVEQDHARAHQLKFQVAQGEGKAGIIKDLLHRTPDIIILGELLVETETKAFFHALSTGMRGLQTIHAASTGEFIKRMREDFGISKTKLESLDVIVLMKKFENGQRKVLEISGITRDETGDVQAHGLTRLDPASGSWSMLEPLQSEFLARYLATTRLDGKKLTDYLRSIESLLEEELANHASGTYHRDTFLAALNKLYAGILTCL